MGKLFGRSLLRQMIRQRMSISELCQRTGLSYDHVRALTRGYEPPTPDDFLLITAALDTTVTSLLEDFADQLPYKLVGVERVPDWTGELSRPTVDWLAKMEAYANRSSANDP
jgi:transcriptional regulator with XRE-family HTH domain